MKTENRAVAFLRNLLFGAGIGIAFIIPGFSGGSVAAILGIYDRLLTAITGIVKDFKASISFLLPILLGMLLGIAALIFPLQWALANFPIVTVTLFVGLTLGGLPTIAKNTHGLSVKSILPFLLPCLLAASIGFLPNMGDVDLFTLSFGGYILLFLVGILGASALVVPGISGSMLLLIFGYYNPILSLLTDYLLHGSEVGHCLLVFLVVALGIVVGFFGISWVMKRLLAKYPKGTYTAILGFVIGSLPSVYLATISTHPNFQMNAGGWVCTVLALLIGIAISLGLGVLAKKKEIE